MIELSSLRPESRYGMPAPDSSLFNRAYVVGYSDLFRQPKWARELIDAASQRIGDEELARLNNFRDDLRIPPMFRATPPCSRTEPSGKSCSCSGVGSAAACCGSVSIQSWKRTGMERQK